MSHVKTGHLSAYSEWAKHLRPWYKRAFWKRHRSVENVAAEKSAGIETAVRINGTRIGKAVE